MPKLNTRKLNTRIFQLWKIINSKLGNKGKEDNNISEIYDENNEIVKDPSKIAKIMNDYYGKMGKDMSDKSTAPSNNFIELPSSNVNSIFLNSTNEMEVKKIIENMKIKNGCVDKINAKTLKTISEHIALWHRSSINVLKRQYGRMR